MASIGHLCASLSVMKIQKKIKCRQILKSTISNHNGSSSHLPVQHTTVIVTYLAKNIISASRRVLHHEKQNLIVILAKNLLWFGVAFPNQKFGKEWDSIVLPLTQGGAGLYLISYAPLCDNNSYPQILFQGFCKSKYNNSFTLLRFTIFQASFKVLYIFTESPVPCKLRSRDIDKDQSSNLNPGRLAPEIIVLNIRLD